MKSPVDLLNEPEFWLYYQRGEEEGLEESLLRKYFGESSDEESERELDPLKVPLACHELTFELDVYVDFYAINCWFRVPDDETEFQVGWWDFDGWHPFGIKWDELMLLWEFWKSNPEGLSVSPDQALLLLAKFVGTGKSELPLVPARKQVIKSAYGRLGLPFDFKQINELASCTFLLPSEEDYEWSEDGKLGPVFSGSYPCYSLRNSHHITGEEGVFPFEPFRKLMQKLGSAKTV